MDHVLLDRRQVYRVGGQDRAKYYQSQDPKPGDACPSTPNPDSLEPPAACHEKPLVVKFLFAKTFPL
jgi:hypothetical protein